MKPSPLNLLLNLAKQAGKKTTIQLAEETGVSQQTVSRWLKQLQDDGLVEKTPQGFKLTQGAWSIFRQFQTPGKSKLEMRGTVVQGLGEGSYYLSLPGYRTQIKEKVGFDPYLGTLNLKLETQADLQNRERLASLPSIQINGFRDEKLGRFFGGAKCYIVKAGGVQGALIIPDRTHHSPNIIEVISPAHLRTKLKLKNGSEVKISIQ